MTGVADVRDEEPRLVAWNFALQAEDVTDHLGHGLEMLGRHRLIDLDGGVQRAGKRRVFDHRHIVFLGHRADAQRQEAT